MADPAIFLALNSVLGTLFSSENSLFIQLWTQICMYLGLYYYLINVAKLSKTTHCPFHNLSTIRKKKKKKERKKKKSVVAPPQIWRLLSSVYLVWLSMFGFWTDATFWLRFWHFTDITVIHLQRKSDLQNHQWWKIIISNCPSSMQHCFDSSIQNQMLWFVQLHHYITSSCLLCATLKFLCKHDISHVCEIADLD